MTAKLDDRPLFIRRFSDICSTCEHFKLNPRATSPTCKAFPKGIPTEIWEGRNNHTQPYPGDNGIQYQVRTSIPF